MKDIAFGRGAPFAVKCVGFEKRPGQTFVDARTETPVIGDQFADGKTFLRIMDRRREIVSQFQFPEFLLQLRPGVNATGHADWQHAGRRDRLALQFREFGFHLLVAQTERRTAASVDSVKFVFLRAVNDGEEIAADAVRNRFGQAERGVRGDRSIHRAPAAFQNLEADLRGERHARANHAVSGQHFRAGGEILSGNPVDLSVERKRECKEKRGRGRNKSNQR